LDSGDLRLHGLRADRRISGRSIPSQDPLYIALTSIPHRERSLRRLAASDRAMELRRNPEHLRRPVVSDDRGSDAFHSGAVAAEGDEARSDLGRGRACGHWQSWSIENRAKPKNSE